MRFTIESFEGPCLILKVNLNITLDIKHQPVVYVGDTARNSSSPSSSGSSNRPECIKTCFSIRAPLGRAETTRKRVGVPDFCEGDSINTRPPIQKTDEPLSFGLLSWQELYPPRFATNTTPLGCVQVRLDGMMEIKLRLLYERADMPWLFPKQDMVVKGKSMS